MKNLFIPNKKNNYKPYLLRKVSLVIYTVILVSVNSFGGFLGISQVQASSITTSSIISLANQQRSAAGLNTLYTNEKLNAAALAKANNMFEEQYWDHFGPNGETPWQFIIAAGYNYVYAGENLAKGFRTAEGVHEAWMASPTHRDNIMSPNYKDIGVAVVDGVLLGQQTTLVVQMFGNLTKEVFTPAAPPTVTETIKKATVVDNGQIKAISITKPKPEEVLINSVFDVEGEVENYRTKYTVEIYEGEEVVGEVESNSKDWSYNTGNEWEDGNYEIFAKVKGLNIKSGEVNFSIDTQPPMVIMESLEVIREDSRYIVRFDTDSAWEKLEIRNGEDIFTYGSSDEEIVLENFEPSDSVNILLYDVLGNSSETDISEYFLEGEEDEYSNFSWPLFLSTFKGSQGINIIIVSFILLLILIEVYVLWKKGKLGKNVNDLFVIGLWVTLLTIGIFKGFGAILV